MLSLDIKIWLQATGVSMTTHQVGSIFGVPQFDRNTGGLATGGLGLVCFVACAASCFWLVEQFGRVRTSYSACSLSLSA
jgi:hypothetical protein